MHRPPEGYTVTFHNDSEEVLSVVLRVRRPDGSVVAESSVKKLDAKALDTMSSVAWRDHRERTLRVVDDEPAPRKPDSSGAE